MGLVVREIQETRVNASDNHIVGESEYYEPYETNPLQLFRHLQREYGRCISKLYQDRDGQVLVCGWVFQKRVRYIDDGSDYLCEMWISVQWGWE